MGISHYFGISEYLFKQKNQSARILYQPESLINGHMLLCGMSGTGKSFQSARLLNSAAMGGAEVDIFDVHEELDTTPGIVSCKYSQATGYGYNPLVINIEPHSGGVDVQVNALVKLVKEATPQFGAKQEAALRYLLIDIYAASGIRQKDAWTWKRDEMTEDVRENLINTKNFEGLRKYYPTLEDLKSYAKRKIISLTIGGDNPSITSFEQLRRMKAKLSGLQNKFSKSTDDAEIDRLTGQIEEHQSKCIDAYSNFIGQMKTGREIDDVMKYDSVDILSSVLQRLDTLIMSGGVFRSNPPPFGDARIRCHQIKSISDEQQVMFVKLRLAAIFERWKQVGPTQSGTEIRHVIFLDEAHKYFSKERDNIINIIAKEGRKFGIALWCASQQPTEFPEAFLTNVGATVLLGIHSSFWKKTTQMLRVTEDQLKFIRAKEVISIKLQRDGASDPPFQNVIVPNPSSPGGIAAEKML